MRHLQIALLLLTLLDVAEAAGASNYTRHNASTCLPMCIEEVHCECVATLMQTAGKSERTALSECLTRMKAGEGKFFAAGCTQQCQMPPEFRCDKMIAARNTLLPTLPATPVKCTPQNKGRCSCPSLEPHRPPDDPWRDSTTYTWRQGCEQRCVTVYKPGKGATLPTGVPLAQLQSRKLPVMLSMNCYSKDKPYQMDESFSNAIKFGIAWLWLSSPTGMWSGQRAACGTVANPMDSCNNNPDLEYVDTILKHIVAPAKDLDGANVYASGFSQDGMFSGFVGVCLGSSRIAGAFVGAGGLYIKGGLAPKPAGGEAQQARCKYFPAYPCREAGQSGGLMQRRDKFKMCLQAYANDGITVNQAATDHSHLSYMYNALKLEQYDATSLLFPGGKGGKGHSLPIEAHAWMISCLGIPTLQGSCSPACTQAVTKCVGTDRKRYGLCVAESRPKECPKKCTPTLPMLLLSEDPPTITSTSYGAWGTKHVGRSSVVAAPSGSKCKWAAPKLPDSSTIQCSSLSKDGRVGQHGHGKNGKLAMERGDGVVLAVVLCVCGAVGAAVVYAIKRGQDGGFASSAVSPRSSSRQLPNSEETAPILSPALGTSTAPSSSLVSARSPTNKGRGPGGSDSDWGSV